MAVKSAADALKRWQAAMSSGTARQNYIDGINSTTVNPMAEAATPAAMQKYRDNVLESITSGRRERKLMQASAAVWKANAVNFGASKLADAAKKGRPSTRHGHNRRRAPGSKCRTPPRQRPGLWKRSGQRSTCNSRRPASPPSDSLLGAQGGAPPLFRER
jgi:hypothetical protein